MKSEKKKDGDCRVRLSISATAEEIAEPYGKILNAYIKNAQVRGFRKGKVPKEIILRNYGKSINSEATSTLFRKFVDEAVEAEKLDVAGIVDAENLDFSPEKGISFTAIIDLNPEFKLPKYKGLPVKYTKPIVKDEDVEGQMKMIRERFAKSAETDEPSKDGDYLNISFESDIDESGFSDKEKETAARYVKSDNFWLQVGEKPYYEAIPNSAKELLGKKKGDEFSFKAEFPADAAVECLRKVKATYTGKVIKVNTSIPATDEEICKGLAQESIEKLREMVTKKIESSLEAAEIRRMEDEIEQYFLKKCDFAVPEIVVRQAARACGDGVVEAEIAGKTDAAGMSDYIKDHAEELRKKIDERAEALVRLNYIGKALGKELDISATEKDVKDAVSAQAEMAAMQGREFNAEKGYANLVKNGLVSYYQARILYGRVVQWIIDNDIKASAK